MKTRNVVAVLSLGIVLALSLGLAARQNAGTGAREVKPQGTGAAFTVDPVHSTLIFKIMHMGVANFYGRFNGVEGTYTLDEADPSKSQFAFQVKTANVDTGNEKRDGHLKSADFFNAEEYPVISFKSTKVERTGEKTAKVTGDLSMHGVTKPVTIDINITTAKQTRQGFKGGLETTFTIKRTDFEMDTYVAEGGLGDEVTLMVAIEGARP